MNQLLAQAQQLSEQLLSDKQLVDSQVFEGQAGGGAVKVTVTGAFEFRSVSIARAAVDPDDVEMLEDLVLAALNDAIGQIGVAGGDDPDLEGLDLGALLGGTGIEGMLRGDSED